MVPRRFGWLVLAAALIGGCSQCGEGSKQVVIYTSVDQVYAEPVLRQCETKTGLQVRGVFDTEEAKSTGVLNRLIAEAAHPRADLFWSGDPVRPFVLMDKGLIDPYVSSQAEAMPTAFRDARGLWHGFAARARVLLVNRDAVGADATPRSIRDLAASRWRGQTAIANPLFGTTTMHVAALFVHWGDERAKAFLDSLKQNEVRIAASNGEVKRLVTGGEIAFGLTDTDDAHQAVKEGAPVEVVYPDQDDLGTLVMPTTVVLMRGRPHTEAGRRMVDCLLSQEVERQMAESAAHMPLRAAVPTPPEVRAVESIKAMEVDYGEVGKAMERIEPWLRKWVGL